MLLAEALRKSVAAGEVAAARLIVMDAVDEDEATFLPAVRFRPSTRESAPVLPPHERCSRQP